MFTKNRFYWSTCDFILMVQIFSFTDDMTFPSWKMVPVDAFVIWYSLNELINIYQFVFLHKLPQNKFALVLHTLGLWIWQSLPLLLIFRFPVVIWPSGLRIKELYLLHFTELGSSRNSSKKWITNWLQLKELI